MRQIEFSEKRPSGDFRRSGQGYQKSLMLAAVLVGASALSVQANGLGEDRSWQFDTSADKANKAAVLDLIERKKGGYFDSFDTTVNYYIGTQINCSNTASATGNIADNAQTGNAPDVSADGTLTADSTGNISDSTSTTDGLGDSGSVDGSQTNTGDVDSSVWGSRVDGSNVLNLDGSNQHLDNIQDNSGDQIATVDNSTACDMGGSTLTGNVTVDPTGTSGALN
ncbi:hypothetical protein SAMN06265173_10534 [Thalassovita litoralis]|uniref:Uncharacterized protein n=1 Tax=Thalassovita litoralis TaxID=1010611 RepID=A0A521C0X3_9RHOB|nr:hypothetical protein [Thalassovita litoralis]SMO53053.1 hypothetical protein SAMN06265173_10534 [Thalassovita litoralis]